VCHALCCASTLTAAAVEFQLKQVWRSRHNAARQLGEITAEKRELVAENMKLRRQLAACCGADGGGNGAGGSE
jgi:hypothetical protein